VPDDETTLEIHTVETESPTEDSDPKWLKELRAKLPDTSVCGTDNSDRIFGGTETSIGEFPWVVLLKNIDCKKYH
jgi:hypothetical protein